MLKRVTNMLPTVKFIKQCYLKTNTVLKNHKIINNWTFKLKTVNIDFINVYLIGKSKNNNRINQ